MLWFAWKFLSLWYQTQQILILPLHCNCCDLLENFYLCGIKHNNMRKILIGISVVICLKISIFVVSNTTALCYYKKSIKLWFAWKFLSLWYQTQRLVFFPYSIQSCDLLENFYLCGIKHNIARETSRQMGLWFAWKFLSLWYQTQL